MFSSAFQIEAHLVMSKMSANIRPETNLIFGNTFKANKFSITKISNQQNACLPVKEIKAEQVPFRKATRNM